MNRQYEAAFDLAHVHYVHHSRPELIELRGLDADDRPGELHGLIVRAAGGSWYWTCHVCPKDHAGYDTDGDAWLAFLVHEDQAHTVLAPIVSIEGWRARHAG